MDDKEKDELLDALTERLRAEGAPAGVWMLEIAQVREALRAADDLLLRLSDALLHGFPPPN